jgi:hypothetical protein
VDKSKLKAKVNGESPQLNGSNSKSPHKNQNKHMNGHATNGVEKHTKEMNGSNGIDINGVGAKMNGHGVDTNGSANEKQPEEDTNIDKEVNTNAELIEQLKLACSRQNKEACLMCSS